MKIVIVGTQSVGKTTIFEALKKEDIFKDFVFCAEHASDYKNKFKLIWGDPDLQLHGFFTHLFNEERYCNMISDRSMIDNIAYSIYFQSFSELIIENMLNFLKEKVRYDLVVYIPPLIDYVHEDGHRFRRGRMEVDGIIRSIFDMIPEYKILSINTTNIKKNVKSIILSAGLYDSKS